MRKLVVAAGAIVLAVGATFVVGLFVGHWFGFGEEAAVVTSSIEVWTPVTLPLAEAQDRVGPLEEFPALLDAQEDLDSARTKLATAQATLATASPNDYQVNLVQYEANVRVQRAAVERAEESRAQASEQHRLAVQEMAHRIVEEVHQAEGADSELTARAALTDAEWVFCDLNWEAAALAATSLGLLPDNPGEDLFTYWWVARPDEYIRACKAAFAVR